MFVHIPDYPSVVSFNETQLRVLIKNPAVLQLKKK